MSKINVDVRTRALAPDRLAMRVVYQSLAVAAFLPFQASDGTLLTVIGREGRPCAAVCGGRLTVGLRGGACPDEYRGEPVVMAVPKAEQAAVSVRAAVRELRGYMNRKGAARGR